MKLHYSNLSVNNTDLPYYHWETKNAKAVVVLIHGMGEHAFRYEESVIKHLLANNYAVMSYDNFGHGKTEGKRGHCPSYEALQLGVAEAIEKTKALYPEKPIFLYGHSMGGNLVLKYAMSGASKLKGVIATSPLLQLAFQPPKWKTSLGKLMLRIYPSITLPSGLEVDAISRDAEEVKRYQEDPLVHDKVSPMFSFPVFEAGEFIIDHAKQIQLPTLVVHGSGDRITSHKASETFASRSNNVTFKMFEGGYHELHHDICKEEFIAVIVKWLNSKL